MINLELINDCIKKLRSEISNNKDIWNIGDKRMYNLCSAVNCLELIRKQETKCQFIK